MIHRLNEACHPRQNCSNEWLFDIHLIIFSGGSIPSASAQRRKNRQIKRNLIHMSFRVIYAAAAISNTVNCENKPELMTAKKGNLWVRYSRSARQASQRRPYIHGTRFWCSTWCGGYEGGGVSGWVGGWGGRLGERMAWYKVLTGCIVFVLWDSKSAWF